MPPLDDWLDHAAHLMHRPPPEDALARLRGRIASQTGFSQLWRRRKLRRVVVGVAASTMLSFFGGQWVAGMVLQGASSPTWLAAPPAASPYGLLAAWR